MTHPPLLPAEDRALRASVAFVWLATGLLVLTPGYREVGGAYLSDLGLPLWLMPATCAAEVMLGLGLLVLPMSAPLALLQLGLMAGFTLILAVHEPLLLAHPFGVLTKNLAIVACVLVAWKGRTEGWSPRVGWALRLGAALPWFTEGLFPKILFQQPIELAVVAGSPFSWGDPAVFLRVLGAAQVLSFVAALTLRGRPLQVLLWLQAAALLLLPLLVSLELPELWVHPFGPLIKNVPILTATLLWSRRCSS